MDDKAKDLFLKDLINLRKSSYNRSTEPGLEQFYILPPNDYFFPGNGSKMSRNKHLPVFMPFMNNYSDNYFDLFENDAYFNRQPMKKKFKNPRVIAAFERVQPAFESIEHVISTLKTTARALEFMCISFHQLFYGVKGLAECFISMRNILTKFRSTVEWFKLAQWFITKLGRLLGIVSNEPTQVTTPTDEMEPELDIPSSADENEDEFYE